MTTSTTRVVPTAGPNLLEAEGLEKAFGHVRALRGASLALRPGEVVGIVGDNGAGKSTLVKVLSGAERPDRGEMRLDGRPIQFSEPADARRVGIETVYQSLALAPDLNAAENLFLGREIRRRGLIGRLGFIDRQAMRRDAADQFERLGVPLPSLMVPVADLSGGQRQIVAVARAAAFSSRVVFLDEPTAALAVEPARKILELIRTIRKTGVAVVLVSHDLPRLFDVADRIVVMRLGRVAATVSPGESTMDDVVGLMTGATAA